MSYTFFFGEFPLDLNSCLSPAAWGNLEEGRLSLCLTFWNTFHRGLVFSSQMSDELVQHTQKLSTLSEISPVGVEEVRYPILRKSILKNDFIFSKG